MKLFITAIPGLILWQSILCGAPKNPEAYKRMGVCQMVQGELPAAKFSQRGHARPISKSWQSRLLPVLKQYRSLWRDICAGKLNPNFADILVQADAVNVALTHAATAPYFTLDEELAEDWPFVEASRYLPLINYYQPWNDVNTPRFEIDWIAYDALVQQIGDETDKKYARLHLLAVGTDWTPAWSMKGGGYQSACYRYDTYNWIFGLETLQQMASISPSYKKITEKIRRGMLYAFSSTSYDRSVCTCGSVESFKESMKNLEQKLRHLPQHQSLHADLVKLLNAVENGKISIGTYLDSSCQDVIS